MRYIWQRHKHFFRRQPGSKVFSISEPTEEHALLFIWTSAWLDWKTPFVILHADKFLRAKFDNDINTFFVDNPDQKFVLFQNLLGCVHSYSSLHLFWTIPWLDWRTLFVGLHTDTFLSAKFGNDLSTFFVDKPDKKFLTFKNLLGWIHSHSSPKLIRTTLGLDWRTVLVKLHTDTFLSAKFENDLSTFFVDKPNKKFLMFKNLLGWIHSQPSLNFIWTSSWLDWRTLFVKLHTDTLLSAKFDNDMSYFFVDEPEQKFLRFNNLLDCKHSHSSPHFIWTSHGLDWRTHFVKLHTDTFFERKIWQRHEYFIRRRPRSKVPSF